jgi:hypothetical protein
VLHLQNAAQMPLFLLQQVLQHLLQNEDLSSAYRIPGRILSFAHHCCGWMRDGEGSCWKTDFFARAIDSLSLLHINLLQMQIACAAGDGVIASCRDKGSSIVFLVMQVHGLNLAVYTVC